MKKKCTKCHKMKPLTEYFKQAHKADGKRGDCRTCCATSRRKWVKDNPEKYKAQLEKRKNSDWYKDPKHFIKKNKRQRQRRIDLCDSYVKQLLCSPGTIGEGINPNAISKELIEAYRAVVLLKRALGKTAIKPT